ncbi:hypothetical protein [Mesorhizobium sp. M0522]|uniref:hypothetical protein n=1 Tax=Mesorhizobium sp. M0522 TaxID=2956958 RepID=UPI003337D86A
MRDLEAARYSADRAFRQYDAIDPQNRLVAAELELRWNRALARVGEKDSRIAAHDGSTLEPSLLSPIHVAALAADLKAVWSGAENRRKAQEEHRAHPRGGPPVSMKKP